LYAVDPSNTNTELQDTPLEYREDKLTPYTAGLWASV
jgi:hypothetical protein